MAGFKGMKKRELTMQRPEPCTEDGTGHWRSFNEFGNGRTRQANCHAFNRAMDKLATYIVEEMKGSIEPQQLPYQLDFVKAVEEELEARYNRIIHLNEMENNNDTQAEKEDQA